MICEAERTVGRVVCVNFEDVRLGIHEAATLSYSKTRGAWYEVTSSP